MKKCILFLLVLGCCLFHPVYSYSQDQVEITGGPMEVCGYSEDITYTYVIEYETGNQSGDYILEIACWDGKVKSYSHQGATQGCQNPPELNNQINYIELDVEPNCKGTVEIEIAWVDWWPNWTPHLRAVLEFEPTPWHDYEFVEIVVNPQASQCQCNAEFLLLEDCDNDDCIFYFFNNSTSGGGSPITSHVWKVRDINGLAGKTFNTFNLAYKPPCNGPFEVCLEITNAYGCTDEECMTFDVDCTDCTCVPGPDPCIAIGGGGGGIGFIDGNENNTDEIDEDKSNSSLGQEQIQKIVVYPNPSKGHFELLTDLPETANENTINVFDTSGKLVFEKKIPAGKNKHQIELEAVPSGIYLLKLISNGKVLYQDKLIIAK